MLRSCRTALLVVLAVSIATAREGPFPAPRESLESARRAQAMLGPGTWTRLIHIENQAVRSVYPREVIALIFEFAGILWFYTDVDGTQSFSLHRNDLAAEQADFGPLLREIEPGFTSYATVATRPFDRPAGRAAPLRNGCFIESIAALGERITDGEVIVRAELLSYYAERHGRRLGHTVLVYETPRGAFAVDPDDDRTVRIGPAFGGDALGIARRLRPRLEIATARWVPAKGNALMAGGDGPRTQAGKAL